MQALRHLMTLMRGELHQFIADSFYEVLLNARVHVAMHGNGVSWVYGPGGQRALPVFLDREALVAWGGGAVQGSTLSMPEAAALAASVRDAWLAVDFGSPLNQPIARAGVEALARKSYPGAERYSEQWLLVNEVATGLRQGHLESQLRQRAQQVKFYTLGEMRGGGEPPTGQIQVFESKGSSILSVRGPGDQSYLPAWPSPGGSFEYSPAARHRLVLPLATLVEGAIALECGLVLGLPVPYINIPFRQLKTLWGSA